jgi:hypothetical protein
LLSSGVRRIDGPSRHSCLKKAAASGDFLVPKLSRYLVPKLCLGMPFPEAPLRGRHRRYDAQSLTTSFPTGTIVGWLPLSGKAREFPQ